MPSFARVAPDLKLEAMTAVLAQISPLVEPQLLLLIVLAVIVVEEEAVDGADGEEGVGIVVLARPDLLDDVLGEGVPQELDDLAVVDDVQGVSLVQVFFSVTRRLKKLNCDFTISISSISKHTALITFSVKMSMLPLLESLTRCSTASRNLLACSKFILPMKRLRRKHLASSMPLDLVKALTRRELMRSGWLLICRKYSR